MRNRKERGEGQREERDFRSPRNRWKQNEKGKEKVQKYRSSKFKEQ